MLPFVTWTLENTDGGAGLYHEATVPTGLLLTGLKDTRPVLTDLAS